MGEQRVVAEAHSSVVTRAPPLNVGGQHQWQARDSRPAFALQSCSAYYMWYVVGSVATETFYEIRLAGVNSFAKHQWIIRSWEAQTPLSLCCNRLRLKLRGDDVGSSVIMNSLDR